MNMETGLTTHTSVRDFLHVVFKRKNRILLFFIATVFTVAIGSLVVKPTYEATSQVLVKIGRENLYVPASGNPSPVVSINREEQINSEIEILQSRFLAEKVVKSLGPTVIYKDLKEDGQGFLSGLSAARAHAGQTPLDKATSYLQKALKVEGVRKSDVIHVSFRHTDPQMAATVVNTLVSFYFEHHLKVHKNPESYEFFQEQSDILRNKLNQSEERLEAFKKEQVVSSLDEERSLLLKQEADLRAALNQTLSHVSEITNRINQLRQQLATSKTIPLDEEIDHNPYVINTLEARLVELELKEQELLSQYTEKSRLVKNVREEIQMVRDKLSEQGAKPYGRTRSGVNTTYQRLEEELLRNETELKAMRAKKNTQSGHLSAYGKKLEKLNQIEVEYNQLKQQVEVDRQNYRLYLSKFEESRISDAMDTQKIANVSVIEPAQAPIKPVSPKILLNVVLALFLGGFGGLGLAFFSEYVDDSLEKAEDVETHLQLPVLASIPEMRK